jgi:uroporphyrinogen-III synthase
MRVVITRSKEGNLELASKLRSLGITPMEVDTLAFVAPDWSNIDPYFKEISSFDWLVFTSSTGVVFFAKRMKKLSLSTEWNDKPLVAAIGEKTAESLHRYGIRASFIPSEYTTSTLARELPIEHGKKVLLLRADIADLALVDNLRRRGFEVKELAIYHTKYLSNQFNTGDVLNADLMIFASPSAVKSFCAQFPGDMLSELLKVRVACIGPVTAEAARKAGFTSLVVPKVHTIDSLLKEIEELKEIA